MARFHPLGRSHAGEIPARPPGVRRALRFRSRGVSDPEARVAEPILFELFRSATDAEAKLLAQYFEAIPALATPADLWSRAAELGRECRRQGIAVGALDLLIAQVAIHHGAELVTFDSDFQRIAQVSGLQVELLQRPTP
jgi:predicted nucleic acid-binding protein